MRLRALPAPILLFVLLAAPSAGAQARAEIFRDATAAVGLDFRHFNGMSGEFYFAEMAGGGAALFDADGDGDLDLYLVQGHMLGPKPLAEARTDAPPQLPLRDRLYRNDLDPATGQFRFVDITEASGLDARGYGMGVAVGDVDGDGRIDLYVTNLGANQLWHNRGPNADGIPVFEDWTQRSGASDPHWSVAAAFLDFDRDGLLDLYVGNYVDFNVTDNKFCPARTGGRDYCSPLAYNPVADRLLRGLGDGRFQDVSKTSGPAAAARAGLGVVSGDFDDDGWIDLYVANDGMANQLWLNQRDGTFLDDAALAGAAVNMDGQPEASMGIAAGDLDGNGSEDLFMTHLHEETNTVYLNSGGAVFLDSTRQSRLGAASFQHTGFGTGIHDFDNDGHLDVLVVNGAVTLSDHAAFLGDGRRGETPRALALDEPNQLFLGNGDGTFDDATERAGAALAQSEVSRGVAFGDLDNDGDVDAVVVNNHGPAQVLLNVVGQDAARLGVRVVDGKRDALGAKVELLRLREGGADVLATRRVRTDGSYASAGDPRLVFGLGAASTKDLPFTKDLAVRVHWVGGEVETFRTIAPNAYRTLIRGNGDGDDRDGDDEDQPEPPDTKNAATDNPPD